MKRILVTGATGNIGMEVVRFLFEIKSGNKIVAAVRNIEKAKQLFKNSPQLEYVTFDLEEQSTFATALENIDSVFLLRPPHIADIELYFKPLIEKIKAKNIQEILFLSVQGAEKSSVIPHNKIEKLIVHSGIDHIFLRPSYFMQNLTTTLSQDIREKRKIILPAGKAKFNWIDAENIGETAALLLEQFGQYKNQFFELTGDENRDFYQVTDLIKQTINIDIGYDNANPFRFYKIKKEDGLPKGMIMVMIMLHFLPRFQKEPQISGFYETLTGKKPITLKEFILREKNHFAPSPISVQNV